MAKNTLWKDEQFLAEIKARIEQYEAGKVKCSTWQEVKQNARQRNKTAK